MKWSIHIYDPDSGTTTTHVKDYPGTSTSMADAPSVVAKASRDFKKHMKYILAVPHRGGKPQHATKRKSPAALDRDIAAVIGQWEEDRQGHRFVTRSDGIRFDTAAVDPSFYRDPKWRQRWEFDLKREIEKFKAGKPTKLYKMSDTHYTLPGTL